MSIDVKICGITCQHDLETLIQAKAKYVGFMFYAPSPRYISCQMAKECVSTLDTDIFKVAVFVNPTALELDSAISAIQPDYIQLHGTETLQEVCHIKERTGLKVIKAFGIAHEDDIYYAKHYETTVDILLFDTKSAHGCLSGGSSVSFDWHLLDGFESPIPWILSGGLTAKNLAQAIHDTGAKTVDVSSGVESTRGIKDTEKIIDFINRAHRIT